MFLSDFVKADLHVHTPESNCYFTTQEVKETEYIQLLRNATENGVNIIAITDHNTIDGYKNLINIKEKYERDLETITRFNLAGEATKEVSDIKSLFSELLILPGVEYTAKPGIHLLIIFDPNIGISEIDDFLNAAGITPEMKGQERKGLGKWYVETALDYANALNAIVFGAHADRDHGIIEDTKGDYRRDILKNDNLHGLEFKNLFNREKIKMILKDPTYHRKSEIALIQNSDYHNKVNQHIGNPCTYIHLEEKSFSYIKEAFLYPLGKITSPDNPEIDFILNKLEKDERSYFLENYSDEERLIKAVIGLANIGSGTILVGENPEQKRLGLDESEIDDAKGFIKNMIQQKVEPIPKITFFDIHINKKCILAVNIKGRAFALYSNKQNNEIFIWKESKPKPAEKEGVMELLKEINKRELNKFLSPKIKRIETLSTQMRKLRDDLEGMYITYKFDKSPLTLGEIFEWLIIGEDQIVGKTQMLGNFKKEIEDINNRFTNGMSKGNTVFLRDTFPPRLEQTVLRYTVPIYEFKKEIEEFSPDIPFEGEKLVLVEGGGIFYSREEKKALTPEMVYGKLNNNIVFLKIKPEYSNCYSIKYLLSYLKSIPLLWLSYSIYDSTNIYKPNIFINLPAPPECDKMEELEKVVDEILSLEKSHLKAEEELKFLMKKSIPDRDKTEKLLTGKIEKHNEQINEKNNFLDRYFLELFGIDEEEKVLMCKMLKSKNIFVSEKL